MHYAVVPENVKRGFTVAHFPPNHVPSANCLLYEWVFPFCHIIARDIDCTTNVETGLLLQF